MITVKGGGDGVLDTNGGRLCGSCVMLRIHVIRESIKLQQINGAATVTNLCSIPQRQQIIFSNGENYIIYEISEEAYSDVTFNTEESGSLFIWDFNSMTPLSKKITIE